MDLDIIKNNELLGGIFSSSYYTNMTDTKHEEIFPLTTQNISIEQGLDFITSHFKEPIWPRVIFTKTLGKQITVYSKQESIARFKQSNLMDCRINAYPDYTEFKTWLTQNICGLEVINNVIICLIQEKNNEKTKKK
jgi:hypothetical protein